MREVDLDGQFLFDSERIWPSCLALPMGVLLEVVSNERQIKCCPDLRGSRRMNDAAGPTVVRVDEQHWNEPLRLHLR